MKTPLREAKLLAVCSCGNEVLVRKPVVMLSNSIGKKVTCTCGQVGFYTWPVDWNDDGDDILIDLSL